MLVYKFFINDVTDKIETIIEVEKYLFDDTLKAILKSNNAIEPKKIKIELWEK